MAALAITAGVALTPTAHASTVLIGEAEATNIRVDAEVSGTLLGAALLLTQVGVQLNPSLASAPAPSSQDLALLNAAASSGLLSVGVGATAAAAFSSSDVDAQPGVRVTNGMAEIESATVGLGLSGLPNLLSLSLGGGDGLMISQSNVTGDGAVGMQPTATSNLLATGADLGISILGLPIPGIDLSALVAGVAADVGVLIDARVLGIGTLIEGTISLLADETFTNPGAGTDDFFALAEATGLQVGIDVRIRDFITPLITTTDLQLNTTVVINETSALMLTPEPGKAVLLALGLFGLVFHQRRR